MYMPAFRAKKLPQRVDGRLGPPCHFLCAHMRNYREK
jgi:hypothetical protein